MRIIALFPNLLEPDELNIKSKFILRKRSYCHELDFFNGIEKEDFPVILNRSFSFSIPENLPIYNQGNFNIRILWIMWEGEAFWQVHEMLESAWKNFQGDAKRALWLIIRVVVAQVKFQMGQYRIHKEILYKIGKEFKDRFLEEPGLNYPFIPSLQVRQKIEDLIQANI